MATESIYNPILLISWTHVDLIFAILWFFVEHWNLRRPHKLGDNSYMLWTTKERGLSAPWNTVIDVWACLQKLVLLRFHPEMNIAGLESRNEIVSKGDICRDNRWSVYLHLRNIWQNQERKRGHFKKFKQTGLLWYMPSLILTNHSIIVKVIISVLNDWFGLLYWY